MLVTFVSMLVTLVIMMVYGNRACDRGRTAGRGRTNTIFDVLSAIVATEDALNGIGQRLMSSLGPIVPSPTMVIMVMETTTTLRIATRSSKVRQKPADKGWDALSLIVTPMAPSLPNRAGARLGNVGVWIS